MLRRAPTAITLTQDDIARYEESRQRRLLAQQQSQAPDAARHNSGSGRQTMQPARSKEDRIMGTGGR
jgi:hypothetical protein